MLRANRIDAFIGHKVVFFLFEKTSCYIILVFGGGRRGRDCVLLSQMLCCKETRFTVNKYEKKKAVPSASLVFTAYFPEWLHQPPHCSKVCKANARSHYINSSSKWLWCIPELVAFLTFKKPERVPYNIGVYLHLPEDKAAYWFACLSDTSSSTHSINEPPALEQMSLLAFQTN